MWKIIGFMVLATMSGGCATYKVISNEKDAWITHEGGSGNVLYYCRGNPDAAGGSLPQCREAKRQATDGAARYF